MHRNLVAAVEIQSGRQRAKQFVGSSHPDPNIYNTAAEKTLSCVSALVFLATGVHQPDPGPQLIHRRAGHSKVLFLSFLIRRKT